MTNEEVEGLVSLFCESAALKKTPRSHQITLLSQDLSDNIAAHSFRTILIGYSLAADIEEANACKTAIMCLFHDLGETRTGDQNWVHKTYVEASEKKVREEQAKKFPKPDEFKGFMQEYEERKSVEAKITKDADCLEELLTLREYALQGNEEAKRWLHFDREGKTELEKKLNTELAKQLAKEIKRQKPSSWWRNLWSST